MGLSELNILSKLLGHKKYEDNGIIFRFFDFEINNDVLFFKLDAKIPEDRGWNDYMIESFAYNIVHHNVIMMGGDFYNIKTKIIKTYVNGIPIKSSDYYLPLNFENKLEDIIDDMPDLEMVFKGFKVKFIITGKDYHLDNGDYQLTLTGNYKINKIILIPDNSEKTLVLTSISQDLAESIYSILDNSSNEDDEVEEYRWTLESELYGEVFGPAFSMNLIDEYYFVFYTNPNEICDKKITNYSGGTMDYYEVEDYFRKLILKSVE